METVDPVRIIVAFTVVLALIGLMAFALRFMANRKHGWGIPADARLSVVETRMLDARKKLVLAKCDDVEYLLFIAPDQTVLLDTIRKAPANDA